MGACGRPVTKMTEIARNRPSGEGNGRDYGVARHGRDTSGRSAGRARRPARLFRRGDEELTAPRGNAIDAVDAQPVDRQTGVIELAPIFMPLWIRYLQPGARAAGLTDWNQFSVMQFGDQLYQAVKERLRVRAVKPGGGDCCRGCRSRCGSGNALRPSVGQRATPATSGRSTGLGLDPRRSGIWDSTRCPRLLRTWRRRRPGSPG
jgi:hypothetical protein